METILIYIIIVLLTSLILYNIHKWLFCKIIEGATGDQTTTYQDPDLDEDPLYLAKINAANIAYLKGQIDTITDLKTQLDAMNEQVESNSSAVQSINTSMQNTGTSSIPDSTTTQNLANTGTSDATVST